MCLGRAITGRSCTTKSRGGPDGAGPDWIGLFGGVSAKFKASDDDLARSERMLQDGLIR